MNQRRFAVSVTLFVALVAAQAQSQDQKPSTPQDRAKAVEIARSLEADPLAKQANDQRRWVVVWLVKTPDITVRVCPILGPLIGSTKNYATEIHTQMVSSAAAFIIENPLKATDDVAVCTAAVEGSLRAYQSILKVKPKTRWPFLDDLLDRQSKGRLVDYVREFLANCKSNG